MAEPNYLLGKGERLVHELRINSAGAERDLPYTFDEARDRLEPRLKTVAATLDALPKEACPNDEAVAAIVLHQTQVAKSYYPSSLLSGLGLRAVGSRPTSVQAGDHGVQTDSTTELFVAAPRRVFRSVAEGIQSWTAQVPWAADLQRIRDVRVPAPEERVKPISSTAPEVLCEVVLHGAGESETSQAVLASFVEYLGTLKISVDLSQRIDTSKLSFLAARLPRDQLVAIAKFGFLRAIRLMPRLRQLQPATGIPDPRFASFEFVPPTALPVDRNVTVAIFDGGMPDVPALHPYVTVHNDIEGLGPPHQLFLQHGLSVTSAFLFGPLRKDNPVATPFAHVHHFRVLDTGTFDEPEHELYTVLNRIAGVLRSKHFDYVNVSLGPEIPVDDDDPHPWTVTLDELAAHGATLITSAVGNTGQSPANQMLNRIQPPSDGVNILGVGACDSDGFLWRKAPYSSVGRGRSPGIIKPDGVAFGGSSNEPFWVVDDHDHGLTSPTNGTSVAGPNALRAAVGVRAVLGDDIRPLTAKALLIQSCEKNDLLDRADVGYGRFCTDVAELITCDDRTVHVIYQDTLEPKQWVQAVVPMLPVEDMGGYVTLSATICFATDIDPEHPGLYTRAGLDIVFRKDKYKIKPDKSTAESSSFFRPIEGVSEADLREDWHKWETVRWASGRFQARTLKDPVLDIHYNPRKGGKDWLSGRAIPYAMVISVHAPKVERFYELVKNRYRNKLDALRPRVRLPAGRV